MRYTETWPPFQTGSGLNKISSQISEFALCTDKDKCTIYHSTNPYVISYKKKVGNRPSQEAPYDGVKRWRVKLPKTKTRKIKHAD